jgi:hypothetical protein
MSKTCGKCDKAIETTGDGPDWMNEYQWDAVKAGDYYAECETPTHPNGNCYFWERSNGEINRAAPAEKPPSQFLPTEDGEFNWNTLSTPTSQP